MSGVSGWSGRMYRYYLMGAVTGVLETLGKRLRGRGVDVVDVTATTVLRITDFEGGAVRTTVLSCVEDALEVKQLRAQVVELKAQLGSSFGRTPQMRALELGYSFEEEIPGVCVGLMQDDRGKHVLLRWRADSDRITYALVGVPRELVRLFLEFIDHRPSVTTAKRSDT